MKGAKKGVTRKVASREIMRGDASDGHVSGLVLTKFRSPHLKTDDIFRFSIINTTKAYAFTLFGVILKFLRKTFPLRTPDFVGRILTLNSNAFHMSVHRHFVFALRLSE